MKCEVLNGELPVIAGGAPDAGDLDERCVCGFATNAVSEAIRAAEKVARSGSANLGIIRPRSGNVAALSAVWMSFSPNDRAAFASGVQRCREARLRNLSLTDCVSFESMKRLRITEAIARDAHFEREQISLP